MTALRAGHSILLMEREAPRHEPVRVKVCGLRRPEDARTAVRAGADAVGLVFAESPRRVTLDEAKAVAASAREEAARARRPVEAWGVFVNEEAGRIVELAREVPLDVIQLHGDETLELARALGGMRLVRAVRVRDAGALRDIERLASSGAFEAVLLDSFCERPPAGQVGPRGGTGRTFDWDVAREASRHHRVVLAGGLAPANVRGAVRRVRPWMVDASSGLESAPGEKDAALIERFVTEAKSALGRAT